MAVNATDIYDTEAEAIDAARVFAADGPRVAAVLAATEGFAAAPGFLDADAGRVTQIALVTPDGRVWRHVA